jgi:hypothetical protein
MVGSGPERRRSVSPRSIRRRKSPDDSDRASDCDQNLANLKKHKRRRSSSAT